MDSFSVFKGPIKIFKNKIDLGRPKNVGWSVEDTQQFMSLIIIDQNCVIETLICSKC